MKSIAGKRLVFDFKDEQLKRLVESHGGKVTTAISGLTNILVVHVLDEKKSKVKQARAYGTYIITKDLLMKSYSNSKNSNNANYRSTSKYTSKSTSTSTSSHSPKHLTAIEYDLFDSINDVHDYFKTGKKSSSPLTIDQIERHINAKLKTGDIINYDPDSKYAFAFIVTHDRKLLLNNGEGLQIPYKIGEHLDDILEFYSPIIDAYEFNLEFVEPGKKDRLLREIFTKQSNILKNGRFVIYAEEGIWSSPILEVLYEGVTHAWPIDYDYDEAHYDEYGNSNQSQSRLKSPTRKEKMAFLQVMIEDFFKRIKKQVQPKTPESFHNTLCITSKARYDNTEINLKIPDTLMKKVLPSKSWKVVKDDKAIGTRCYTLAGPKSEAAKLKDALSKL